MTIFTKGEKKHSLPFQKMIVGVSIADRERRKPWLQLLLLITSRTCIIFWLFRSENPDHGNEAPCNFRPYTVFNVDKQT